LMVFTIMNFIRIREFLGSIEWLKYVASDLINPVSSQNLWDSEIPTKKSSINSMIMTHPKKIKRNLNEQFKCDVT
jgi:hypothetical protein